MTSRDSLSDVTELRREVSGLRRRMQDLEGLLLDAVPERLMTIPEAWSRGLLAMRPRTVSDWIYDPEARARYHVDLLIERVGRRIYTSPARISKWHAAIRAGVRSKGGIADREVTHFHQASAAQRLARRVAAASKEPIPSDLPPEAPGGASREE